MLITPREIVMKKKLFKWHSYAGLIAFLPILLLCLSGSFIVFKYEIDSLIRDDVVGVSVTENQQRLSQDVLLNMVGERFHDHEVVGWVLFQNPERSDVVYIMPRGTSDWYHIYVNGYTGDILSQPAQSTDNLTDWMVEFHASFLLHETGLFVATIFSLVLVFLGVSGLILHKRFWKNLFKLRTSAKRILYYSDLHKLFGAWFSPILLVLGFTGAYWNVAHLLHELEHHMEDDHFVMSERMYGRNLSLDQLLSEASNHVEGFKTTYISLPHEPGDELSLYGDVPGDSFLTSQYANVVTYDRMTGEYLSSYDIRNAPLWHVIVDSFRKLHFGTFAGTTSRVIWLLAGLAPLILTFSGLYIWWKRRAIRQRKKLKNQTLKQETLIIESKQKEA